MGNQRSIWATTWFTPMLPDYTQAKNLFARIIAITRKCLKQAANGRTKNGRNHEVPIFPDFPEHKIQIDARFNDTLRERMLTFLSQNHDCFAWSHEDMTRIDPKVVVHRLQIDPDYQPVNQRRRKFAFEQNKIINDEIQKLIDIGSIREVQYPKWLTNVVVIQKKNEKWCVCIDFTDLNKACPKIHSRCHT